MKFSIKPFTIPLVWVGKYLLRLLIYTCRFEIEGLDRFIKKASSGPCILVFWHNRLAIVAEFFNRHAPQFIYAAFVSKSRDGEILSRLATSYRSGRVIRVPHNARHQALKTAIESLKLKNEILLFTPDGPRGPLYQVKPGIIKAAQEGEAAIIPFSWKADRYWKLKTWDQFMLPKPFSKIQVTFGESIYFDKDENIQTAAKQLEKVLNQ